MARHTRNSAEIPHLWYHQTQDKAYNSSKTFYFEGRDIYSYGSHFVIASLVENKKGDKAVLFTTRDYSISTSGHKNATRRAIPGDVTVFYLPLIDYGRQEDHVKEYLNGFARQIKAASDATMTPRIRQVTRLKHFESALSLIDEANRFAEFFGERQRFKAPDSMEALRGEVEAHQKRQAAKIARDDKAARKRRVMAAQAYREAHAEDLQRWLNGGRSVFFGYSRFGGIDGSAWDTAFLRIVDEEVETSLGVKVPLTHAKLALRIVLKCRAQKQPYQRNGHTIHIGHYALDTIDTEGNVKAGCHNITWAEIERFANKYGLMPEAGGADDGPTA